MSTAKSIICFFSGTIYQSLLAQHGDQTYATSCAQQCCDMLRRNVAIVWPGLANTGSTMLWCVALRCCHRLVGTCWVRLATVLQRVATCWVLLAQIWKWSNFSCNICACCMMLWSFGQVRATMVRLGMRISSIFNPQQVATRRNREAKRKQHVAPNNIVKNVKCLFMVVMHLATPS